MQYDPERMLRDIRNAESVVVGQIGQTLDGKVATETGESLYINGEAALTHLHRLRASVDALIVGAGTVATDNPRLTVRMASGETPMRVIVDPNGRVPEDRQCFQDDAGPVAVIRATGGPAGNPLPSRIERIEMPRNADEPIPLPAIIAMLAKRGKRRVLIEGGPHTLSLALAQDAVDMLHVMVAPKILGSGKQGLVLPPVAHLADALAPECEISRFSDGDILFNCNLRKMRQHT